MKNIFRTAYLLCVAVLLQFSMVAHAQTTLPNNIPELKNIAGKAYYEQDYGLFRQAMEKLHNARPFNSEYMYQLAIARALQNDKRAAYDLMLQMQRQGLSYDFDATDDSKNIRGTEVYEYLTDLMRRANNPMGEVEEAFSLPEEVLFPEALTWDPSRERLLVGTIRDGSILSVSLDGEMETLIEANNENGLWGIFDLVVDVENNRLWVTSSAVQQFKGFHPTDLGRSALYEFNLENLELIKRYPVPVDGLPHILANMALAPNGDLFIADAARPIIYKKTPEVDKLIPFMASPEMVSLRGLAIHEKGRVMYVADYEMGILAVDLEGQRARPLDTPETLNVGGIDGLYYWDNHLIVVQNGISPERVLRLELDPNGVKVTNIRPLAVAMEEFNGPNYGAIVDEDFYYFGNSHWVEQGETFSPVQVLRTGLDSGSDIVPPEMQRMLAERARRAQENIRPPTSGAPGLLARPQESEAEQEEPAAETENPEDAN